MLESEQLRQELSQKYHMDLEKYKWSEELSQRIFAIKLDPLYEDKIYTMQEVYEKGLNIGNCGLTSRYFAREWKEAEMHVGICDLLKGTKKAENGSHAWITVNDIIIDSTMMITIPATEASQFYHSDKVLAPESARMLPEYHTYSQELRSRSR